MDGKIIKGFCISMLALQFVFFGLVQYSQHHSLWYIPANLFLLLFVFCLICLQILKPAEKRQRYVFSGEQSGKGAKK